MATKISKIANKLQQTVVDSKSYTDMNPNINDVAIDRNETMNTVFDKPEFDPTIRVVTEDDGTVHIFEGEDALIEARNPDFSDNLAEHLDYDLLCNIGSDLIDKYEEDKHAREPRDKQYDDAMRKSGLDPDASPAGADFEGSAEVVHPMMSKAAVDFAARSIKELCPASGPVKSEVLGEITSKKIDESQRKVSFLNYTLMHLMPYRRVFQQMLSQLPLGGSQFIKFWHDPYLRRPNCEFLPIDKIYIPYACNDFYTAERVTILTELSGYEYCKRIKEGMYYDEDYYDEEDDLNDGREGFSFPKGQSFSNEIQSRTKTQKTNDKIEGKAEVSGEEDVYTLLEVYTYIKIKEDDYSEGEYAPYIVTVRLDSGAVIGLYRNWKLEDKKRQKLDYIVKFPFIVWRGAYDLGIGQLIGSLSSAATGSLRALLDAAHVNNAPTLIGVKGIKMAGQAPSMGIGQINMLEGPAGMDTDIRKFMMPLPFNAPSPVLFQLLEFMTQQADTVVKMPDGVIDGMGDRTPANTTLAMIEQGSTTQSAIHSNLHFEQIRCFNIICRLLKDHFDEDGYPDWLLEDYKINRALFDNTRDIVPVSDPNIFTEVQRYAQMENVMKLAQNDPSKFNMDEIYRRMLQLIKVPQADMLLNIPSQVRKANAVAENASVMMGGGIQVYPDQNHLDHLLVHMSFLKDPIYGQTQPINMNNTQLLDHIKEHLMYLYCQYYQQAVRSESPIGDYNVLNNDTELYDNIIKDVTPSVLQAIQETLAPYIPEAQQILQSLMQMQQQQQQQNMNPQQIALQIEQAKLQQVQSNAQNVTQKNQIDAQESQAKIQLEQQKLQLQQQIEQQKMELERLKAQSEIEVANIQLETENKESDASIYIEELRAENDRKNAQDQLQLEHLKHQNDLHLKALEHGSKIGIDMMKHRNELHLKSSIEDKKLKASRAKAKTKKS